MNKLLLEEKLKGFFIEDIGYGDRTSALIFGNERATASFIAKDSGIFCGKDIVHLGYTLLSSEMSFEFFKEDGEQVNSGEIIAKVEGPIKDLLCGERVILNLIQKMSGIATATNEAVTILSGSTIRICDTRKTTPGLRLFEKYAVTCGGGFNHRYGLDDGIMLKDNHLLHAGSIQEAVSKIKKSSGHMVKVEIEVDSFEQLKEAIETEADVIMLDNVPPEEAALWRKEIPSTFTVEISGGITLSNIHTYKNSAVDYISLGALTHSVKALDISLDLNEKGE